MAIALESGGRLAGARCRPGRSLHARTQGCALAGRVVAYAHMARSAIERICLDVQEAAIRSVGAAGLMRAHPMEQIVRDLTMYLRQPAPDAALAAVGRHVLECELAVPDLWDSEGDR